EQPNNSPPDVQYIGKRGEPEAPQFLYETSGVKNIVYGTNAPKDSRDYDEVLGDPVFDPHEPHPETQPEFFDEQGRKLSGPVPEDVEVEDNPEYDEDRTKGNFWVKRYTDPQTGEPVYIYLHRDQILDPRLKNNIEIKYLDEQLPKIRAWYQEKMMSADPHDRAVALLTALVDQAKFRIREVLLGLRVKDVTVHDHTKITVRLPHGGSTDVTMDRTPMNVLREIMSGKKEDDLIFEVNGDKFDYETFARFMKDNFGVLPSFFHTYHVTELFSKEFHKLVRKDTEELSSDRMDELKQEALKKVADVLHIHDPEFLESHLDPIAMEALYLAAHTTDKKHLSKGSFKLQGRLSFQGLPVSIENKKGSVRKWYDPHGEESGQTKMHFDYGYINGTCGVDGDYVDVYIGPNKESKTVFVVHQMKKPDFKKYDEDKVMLGFDSAKEAKSAYLKQYNDPGFFGALDEIPMNAFKKKVLATAERPCMIKSWHVAVNPPDRDPDETMFSQWVHSYPIHEHYFHWDAYQKKAEDAQFEDIARIGLIGGTKKPPMSGESHAEVSL
ncbi:MAG TPA: hypothetical protein VMW36_05920, partial [Patescibacteria group bacterium]|nr:hypothetical protein [Patescibacteria group bacterium]